MVRPQPRKYSEAHTYHPPDSSELCLRKAEVRFVVALEQEREGRSLRNLLTRFPEARTV